MTSISDLNYAPSPRIPADWQHALTEHLRVLDEICKSNGIKYYMAFGGLLGAVRHRGFIPWDNDVDFVMDEENYNKLVKLDAEGKLPSGYRFVDRNSEEQYPLIFGRFINENTSCPLSTSSFNGGMHGIFVDVFILFPLPKDKALQQKAVTKFLVWEQLQCYLKRRANNRTDDFIAEWKKIKSYEQQHGRAAALEKIEAEFKALLPAFEDSEWCLHGSGGKYNGFARLKTSDFADVKRIPFESIELDAPIGYEEFLEQFYGGSWRHLPSGMKFTPYSGSNLNIPGWVITEDYMQFIDKEKADLCFRKHTDLMMDAMIASHTYETARARTRGELYGNMIAKEIGGKDNIAAFSDPKSIPAQTRDFARTSVDKFGLFYRYQLHKNFSKWHVAIKIDPKLVTASLWALFIADEAYWKVNKLIGLQTEDAPRCSFIDSEANTNLKLALGTCTDLYMAIDRNDGPSIEAAAQILRELCPASVHYDIACAYAIMNQPAACLERIESYSADTRKNDYIAYLEGICRYELDEHDAGSQILSDLNAKTTNGMLMLRISDFCAAKGCALPAAKPQPVVDEAASNSSKLSWPRSRSFGLSAIKPVLRYMTSEVKQQPEKLKAIKQEAVQYEDYIEKCRAYRRLSSDRFVVWERMYPRRQLVEEAVASGSVKRIKDVSWAYVDAVYRLYDRDHLGLHIDSFTLEAVKPYFIQDRDESFFKDYISSIPSIHLKDIEELLREKHVEHPYFNDDWNATM